MTVVVATLLSTASKTPKYWDFTASDAAFLALLEFIAR